MNTKLEKLLEAHSELFNEVCSVARLVYNMKYSDDRVFDDDEVTFYGLYVEVNWETSSCGCCSPDHHCFDFPIEYLFNDDWKDDLRQKAGDKKKEEEAKQLKIEQEEANDKIENEHKQYLKLKEQFGE